MSGMMFLGITGTFIAVFGFFLIMYFIYRSVVGAEAEVQELEVQYFDLEHHQEVVIVPQGQPDVFREELRDSYIEIALWNCGVCHFRNHPDRKLCDLCQTPKGQESSHLIKRIHKEKPMANRNSITGAHRSTFFSKEHTTTPPRPLNKLQLAASRRQQWKRMPADDGLHRWIRQRNVFHRRDSQESEASSSGGVSASGSTVHEDRESTMSVGYIRVRDSSGNLILNEADDVATDFHYRINIFDKSGTKELTMNLEQVHNLPFSHKIRWFSTEIHRLWLPWESGHCELVIRRDHILQDSFEIVQCMKSYQLRQRWRVVFVGEPALDAGGLMREWFTLLFAELFDPKCGLFIPTVGNEQSYWINKNSNNYLEGEHLEYFSFAGRLLGKAILEEHLVPIHLALPFMKHILGIPISFSDLHFLDEEIYQSANQIKATNQVEDLCLDFTVTRLVDGKPVIFELVPDGAQKDVTEANKHEYLDLLFKHHVLGSISDQLLAFLSALYEVVPEGLLKLFDYQELELLICGVPVIDVEDWKKHIDIKYFYPFDEKNNQPNEAEQKNITWLWEVLEEMPNEERVKILQFATGSSRVPAQGFKGLICSDGRVRRFNITFTGTSIPEDMTSLFPKAHTCFNRLDIPIYESKEVMTEYFKYVTEMDITGFSIE